MIELKRWFRELHTDPDISKAITTRLQEWRDG